MANVYYGEKGWLLFLSLVDTFAGARISERLLRAIATSST